MLNPTRGIRRGRRGHDRSQRQPESEQRGEGVPCRGVYSWLSWFNGNGRLWNLMWPAPIGGRTFQRRGVLVCREVFWFTANSKAFGWSLAGRGGRRAAAVAASDREGRWFSRPSWSESGPSLRLSGRPVKQKSARPGRAARPAGRLAVPGGREGREAAFVAVRGRSCRAAGRDQSNQPCRNHRPSRSRRNNQ